MLRLRQLAGLAIGLPALLGIGALSGCGGKAGYPNLATPVTVSLAVSQVVVSQNGAPTGVVVSIMSTSETALVTVGGLPAGVRMTYAASDTNPSGLLTFTASVASPVGTYMPILTVNSAGQTATLTFSLKVVAA
jgi:hypothetical protein